MQVHESGYYNIVSHRHRHIIIINVKALLGTCSSSNPEQVHCFDLKGLVSAQADRLIDVGDEVEGSGERQIRPKCSLWKGT
jgi:hypothetical protein